MDEMTFDRWVRAVGTDTSRRRLLGLASGGVLGGVLAALPGQESVAKRKRHGRQNSHRPGKAKDRRKGQRKDGGGGLGAGEVTPCLGPSSNLQYAVDQAQSGDTLTLCAGTFTEQVLDLSQDLTIVGAGSAQTILSNGVLQSYLWVEMGATVTVRGLTLSGWGTDRAPAISNDGALTLADVTVTKSIGTNAITNEGTLHLSQGSVISGNNAEMAGAGIRNGQGQVTIDAGCRVQDNTFLGEDPQGIMPGGIWSETGSTIILADATIVQSNTSVNCRTSDGTPIVNCNDF